MQKNKRKQRVRRVLLVISVAVLFVVGWYGIGRATSASRSIRLVDRGADPGVVSTQRVDANRSIRVVAYNIAHGRGGSDSNWSDADSRSQRLLDIAALLREMDADVVVLNEVDFCTVWSGHENQAEIIAAAAGYRYRVEQINIDISVPLASYRFGNAILSRLPIHNPKVIDLPGYAVWETVLGGKKQAILCEIALNKGLSVQVVGAHFDTRGDESIRVASANAVADVVGDLDSAVVIAGDLNSTPAVLPGARLDEDLSTAVDVLVEDWGFSRAVQGDALDQAKGTFPSWEPARAIDWILVNRVVRLDRIEVRESGLSDHLPVAADIKLYSTATDIEPALPILGQRAE